MLVENTSVREDLNLMAQRIGEAIAPPIAVPDGEVALTASMGIAIRMPEYRTPNDVIEAADRAMYAAKREKQVPGIEGAAGKPAR